MPISRIVGTAFAAVVVLSACRTSSDKVTQTPPDGQDSGTASGADSGRGTDAGRDAGPGITDACDAGLTECDGYAQLKSCTVNPSTGHTIWTEAPCSAGTACLNGACVTQCADQCNLGDTRPGPDGGTEQCQIFSVGPRGTVDAGTSMIDRARVYNSYLRQWALPAGQVANIDFSAPDLKTVDHYDGVEDSAIWTGTYLAAEALRAKTTHSPDALANVAALVQTLHIDFNVAQSPGWLARFSVPAATSSPTVLSLFSASNAFDHFDGVYNGQTYDWKGHVSRDQYQGVILGYALAYEVLQDEALKEMIRGDVVSLVTELMKTRALCPTIDGVICLIPINVQYVVVTDKEPLNIQITTTGSKTVTLTGMQEFMPMLLGLYPRASSAIMLASFFEVALEVTDGVPAYAQQRAAILQHFNANVDGWLGVAGLWTFGRNCGNSYYANNITFEPMYNLARLELDPTRSATIRSTVLENRLWAGVKDNKDVFFAYIYAANAPATSDITSAVGMANGQLALFPPAPRVHVARNNTFPADPNCPGQALDAIDVDKRVVDDFIWQRSAWTLSNPGNLQQVYPGVDYLVAYWMARYHQFLPDDGVGTCTQWVP